MVRQLNGESKGGSWGCRAVFLHRDAPPLRSSRSSQLEQLVANDGAIKSSLQVARRRQDMPKIKQKEIWDACGLCSAAAPQEAKMRKFSFGQPAITPYL